MSGIRAERSRCAPQCYQVLAKHEKRSRLRTTHCRSTAAAPVWVLRRRECLPQVVRSSLRGLGPPVLPRFLRAPFHSDPPVPSQQYRIFQYLLRRRLEVPERKIVPSESGFSSTQGDEPYALLRRKECGRESAIAIALTVQSRCRHFTETYVRFRTQVPQPYPKCDRGAAYSPGTKPCSVRASPAFAFVTRKHKG